MAKAVKPKVAKAEKPKKSTKATAEVTHSGITETVPISDEGVIKVTPMEDVTLIEVTPPSVTLDEVKQAEVVVEPPKPEPEVIVQTQEVLKPVIEKAIEQIQAARAITNEEISIETKILNFLEGKEGFVRANDFLKSVFGLPKLNEPPQWLKQGNSKLLKSVLEAMQVSEAITVQNNSHRLLGQPYYPDTTTGKQEHRNLNNVEIFIKK